MAKKKKARKIPDPIVGEVSGNVLDEYSSYSYSAKLYMIPPVAQTPPGVKPKSTAGRPPPKAPPGSIARGIGNLFNKSKKKSNGGNAGGFLNHATVALPEETVVLAQSGVTAGNMIDNITIENISKYDSGFETRTINFDIIQPGAANFIDQILLARKKLGMPAFATDSPLFLEIVFQGYDEDLDDVDEGGTPFTHGPFRFRMHLAQISLNVTGEGSTYAVQCVPASQIAYQDQFFRIPKNLSTTGSTLTEHIEDLQKGINEYHENNNDKYQILDEIKIDISGLVGGQYGLKDEKLVTSRRSAGASMVNRQFNPDLSDLGRYELGMEIKRIEKNVSEDDDALEVYVHKDTINVRKGISIYDYMCILLSMNEEFFNSATRSVHNENSYEDMQDPVKRKDAYTKWVKINAKNNFLGFDTFRNVYAKEIIFEPLIYKSVDERVQNTPEENTLTKEETQSRLNEIQSSVFKSYHYLFSGRNDQIYECNIEYDNGIAFLLPPAGGTVGDVGVTSADLFSGSTELNKDITGGALTQKVLQAKDNKNLQDFYKKASDDDIRGLGMALGLNNQELKDAVENKKSKAAAKIQVVLADRNLLTQLVQAEQQAAINNQSSKESQRNPRSSGYVYSVDLIGDIANTINADTLWAKAQAKGREIDKNYEDLEVNHSLLVPGTSKYIKKKEGRDPTDSVQPPIQQVHIVNELGEATFDGSTRQNLMGYYMQQKMEPSFLVKLDMVVKGDPWYLGSPKTEPFESTTPTSESTDESNDEYVVFDKRDNVILFDMQSPRLFDYNVDDEDENWGYWMGAKAGTSYFISGMYMLVKAVSSFSNGEFKQDISMVKLPSYQTSKLEKKSEAVELNKELNKKYGSQ